MKILIDIGHPGHVHFFKNAIHTLKGESNEILITARDKEVSFKLLEAYNIPYINLGKNHKGIFRKTLGLLKTDYKLFKIAKRFKPEVLVGIHNPYIAQVGALLGCRTIIFTDTEHARLANLMTFPFCTTICTPTCFKHDLGTKHIKYDGLHEIAYLHPNFFKPDSNVLRELGLKSTDIFFIIRLVSWSASHDIHYSGFDEIILGKFLKQLQEYGKVFITSETTISQRFDKYILKISPEKIHDVLFYSTLYIGEGATMATEAGLLGTPSIYISPLAGTMGNFEELEKYSLVYSFTDSKKGIDKAIELLKENNLKQKWKINKDKLFEDKIDVTAFIVDFIKNSNNISIEDHI